MKFFYDTEFIEDGKTIDLVSIGMVAENGDSYYAISTEFKARRASQWVKDNVLIHLPERNVNLSDPSISPRVKEESRAWKPRKQIADEIRQFVLSFPPKPEFWGYYADYDHVVLCQIFGTMMDLPKGFPMYTRDIKQLCDDLGNPKLPEQGKGEHHALADARWNQRALNFLAALRGKGHGAMQETVQAETQGKAQVVRTGIFDSQVCVPEGWTDEEVQAFANKENPAGTAQGWIIRKAGDEALNGDPERNPCSQRAGFVHVVLDC